VPAHQFTDLAGSSRAAAKDPDFAPTTAALAAGMGIATADRPVITLPLQMMFYELNVRGV